MEKDIIVINHRHEGRDSGKPFGAYARNRKTGKTFYIGSYSTEEKRNRLSALWLERMYKYPTDQFKDFING